MWSAIAGDRVRGVALPWMLLLAVCVLPASDFWLASAQGQQKAQAAAEPVAAANPAPADAHQDDRAAIATALASFAKAFQTADAKALAAHWTAEGEYQNGSGLVILGRDALESSFAAFFAAAPDPTAEMQRESLRFLSSDVAIAEGTVAVRRGPAEPLKRARYSALLVRDQGDWRLAQLRETDDSEPTIDDLAWLIGEWKSVDGSGAEIHTTYTWDPNKKFIHVRFTFRGEKQSVGGTQMIGVDPETGGIRSWTFESGGGVGEADWTSDGDHWVISAVGTKANGETLVETNTLRRISADVFTWQSVSRTLDDIDLPDLAPVKVSRVVPQP